MKFLRYVFNVVKSNNVVVLTLVRVVHVKMDVVANVKVVLISVLVVYFQLVVVVGVPVVLLSHLMNLPLNSLVRQCL